ncbi:MAG TPA: hypothetical protein PKI34_05975 [Bacteroidales bacterium]|nr:hypothetical protein [Bacteroidales bacterium]
MTGFIVLDTNIYRQLGIKFFEHIDYVNLSNFCYASGYEMSISDIVAIEFKYYFSKEILNERIDRLKQIVRSLNTIPYFKDIKLPNLETKKRNALSEFESKLNSPHFKIKSKKTDAIKLTEFLVENKSSKDYTRDYLIWNSLVAVAQERYNYGDKVCLISNDNIFKENQFLRKGIEKKILDRIEIYNSISDFLFINGFKIDFIDKQYLEEKINYQQIIKDLFERPVDILSYVSTEFWHYTGKVKLLRKEIEFKRVDKFYTYIDPEDKQYKFLAHVICKPLLTFGLPANYKPDLSKLKDWEIEHGVLSTNTFDVSGHPIYEQEVLFLVGGVIDIENKSILKQEVYDFFLDYYQDVYA